MLPAPSVALALSVTLRFHASFDIVAEQAEALELVTPAQIDPASGHARLSVRLKTLTAANDARPFCLEVRAADGGACCVLGVSPCCGCCMEGT